MRIALDAMGGDYAPREMIGGAMLALAELPFIEKLFLTGIKEQIAAELATQNLRDPRIEIVHASEVVDMKDSAVKAVRQKKNSSINVAVDLVKNGQADAVVSAGHTGAAVAACTLKLRTIEGVERAGIAAPIPNLHGTCYLIDAGANVDSRPIHLVQHAIMGSIYACHVDKIERPVVGLMSNGEEEGKGNELTREVFELLKSSSLNFKGNIEGRDILTQNVHVAVCDGFVGNVLLKGVEGSANAVMQLLRGAIVASFRTKIGGLLAKPAFRRVRDRMHYENIGGSPLLGVNGIAIIAHGSSHALAMKNAIRQAVEAIRHGVNPKIREAIARSSALNH